jgi:hypothetical protein
MQVVTLLMHAVCKECIGLQDVINVLVLKGACKQVKQLKRSLPTLLPSCLPHCAPQSCLAAARITHHACAAGFTQYVCIIGNCCLGS